MSGSSARILVLGSPGSGKSTLARRLHALTGLPLFSLDDEYWGPGWSRPYAAAWSERQREITSGDRWLIEGNYFDTIELRAMHTDLVLVLDAPPLLCLWRVIMRAWQIRFRRADNLLPARVRPVVPGQRVKATADFGGLLRLILQFRHRYWWPSLSKALARPEVRITIATRSRRRAAWMETQCSSRNIPAKVAAVDKLEEFVLDWYNARAGAREL